MITIGYSSNHWHFFSSLNLNLVQLCKGWNFTHVKFTTWWLTSIQKCVVLCMLPSYLSCNIHLILRFYVGLKYIRAVPSAVLQTMMLRGKKWWEFRWVCCRGGWNPALPWGGANFQEEEGLVIREEGTDTLVLSKMRLPHRKWSKVGCRASI